MKNPLCAFVKTLCVPLWLKNALTTILFLLMANVAFGQRNYFPDELQSWSISDYIKNDVNRIRVYAYKLDDNPSIWQDSFLIHKMQFDASKNRLFIKRGESVNIEKQYNDMGQIVNEKRIADNDKYFIRLIEETNYEYDTLSKVVKKRDLITIVKQVKRKTVAHEENKTNEYVYNSNGQKTAWYQTISRTAQFYRKNKMPKISYDGSSCQPRHLIAKWEYDSLSNLTEYMYFTQDSLIFKKWDYFYDEQNRLIKETESNHFYLGIIDPYCERITTYEYTDTGKIETKIFYDKDTVHHETISYYDNDDKIVKIGYIGHFREFWESCTNYFYFYENDKLVKIIGSRVMENSRETRYDVWETLYSYNEKGLLTEEQESMNNKLTWQRRYFYE